MRFKDALDAHLKIPTKILLKNAHLMRLKDKILCLVEFSAYRVQRFSSDIGEIIILFYQSPKLDSTGYRWQYK